MVRKIKAHPAFYQKKPWENNENKIWLASTMNLYRNVEKFFFPPKLEKEKRAQIVSLISKSLLHSLDLVHPFLVRSEEIGPIEKEYLVEHFLSSRSFQQAHSGEAFILDETGAFLTILNLSNHIQFELIDCRGELEMAWNHMVKIETELGKTIHFAYNSKFGFLTTDPGHCGTGFVLTVLLQPSALIHLKKLDEILQKNHQEGIVISGLQGNPEERIGDICAIQNHYSIGLTEENIISMIRLFVTKLLVEENSARSLLKNQPNPELMDKVSRAYGILIHSYKIGAKEALNAISLLKLGADLGWLKGVGLAEFNRLFFECRSAHLASRFEEDISQEDIPHRRAEFIHQTLKNASLTI